MSIVQIQIGQCGNQLGAELFNAIYTDSFSKTSLVPSTDRAYTSEALSVFFDESAKSRLHARCVQVDMEEKVLDRLHLAAQCRGTWYYPSNNRFTAKCGSGNNWAYGFFVHANEIERKLEEPIQNQLERCDLLDGLLVTMSLAGGTGSGVGTRLLLHMPDIAPKTPTLTQLVWPYRRGEVSVQAYNAILTLGHLLDPSTVGSLDGFIMHHNDLLHTICLNRLQASNPNVTVGMDQLNALASHQTAGLLQPVAQRNSFGTSFCRRRLSSTIIDLCGHPDYRLLRLRCLPYLGFESRPFATETWSQLARHGRQMLLTGSSAEDRMDWSLMSTGTDAIRRFQQTHLPLLSCVSVLRGQDAMEHVRDPIEFAHESTHGLFGSNRSSFGKSDSSSVVRGHGRPFMNYPRSLFLASNGGGMRFPEPTEITDAHAASNGDTTASLRYAASRAWEMFASRAYLHQYERYGLSTELLMDCFAMVEQIAHDYGSLSWS